MTDVAFRPVIAGKVQVSRITVAEYHRLIESGELPEDPAVELIDGFLVPKDRSAAGEDSMTIGDQHRVALQKLMRPASALEARGCFIQLQQPISLPPRSEPEPDGAIVRGTIDAFRDHPPRAGDVTCVIEVADSSLRFDRTTKLRIYAAAGIRQYVIVNLPNHMIEVFTQPVRRSASFKKREASHVRDIVYLSLGAQKRMEVPAKELLP